MEKKKKDIQLKFLKKKKRKALIYFISTKSNTVVTMVDLLTKQTILSYSKGAACEVKHDEKEEKVKKPLDFKRSFGKSSKKKIKKNKRKKKTKESTDTEGTALTRVYRRTTQAGRILGVEMLNEFAEVLFQFEKKYGVFLIYEFIVYFKGPSRDRKQILKQFFKNKKFKVLFFGDITQLPHNGCRARKTRRTRIKKKPPRLI